MNIELFAECSEKREKGTPCYLDGMGTFYVKRVGTIEQQKEMQELQIVTEGAAVELGYELLVEGVGLDWRH